LFTASKTESDNETQTNTLYVDAGRVDALDKKNAVFLAILVFKEPMLCMFALESEIQKSLTKPCRCYLAGKVRILFHLHLFVLNKVKK
jgi:hypothetical protein